VASKDEFLAMRLLRDTVPGMSRQYISYPMGQLVDALKKYSPVNVDGDITQSPVLEAKNEMVETGES
jgi:hypothetical protein